VPGDNRRIFLADYPEERSRNSKQSTSRRSRAGHEDCVRTIIEPRRFYGESAKKFFRLSPGTEVRLRYAYFIKCREAIKNAAGEIVELRCTYDPATKAAIRPTDAR